MARGLDRAARPGPPSGEDRPRRLALLLRDDGSIAVDRLHQTTRDALKRALAAPSTARDLGLVPDVAPTLALPPALGLALCQGLETLDALIVARLAKAPPSLVREVAAWTDAERAMIAPPLLAVLSKYGGAVLSKYGEEAALVTILISITGQKVALVRDALARQTRPTIVPIRPAEVDAEAPDGSA